jgi:hypothetical protein
MVSELAVRGAQIKLEEVHLSPQVEADVEMQDSKPVVEAQQTTVRFATLKAFQVETDSQTALKTTQSNRHVRESSTRRAHSSQGEAIRTVYA